VIKHINGTLVR